MTFTATIFALAAESGAEVIGPPANKFHEYGVPDTFILPDILAFFGIVASGVIALLLISRRGKAIGPAHYLLGGGLAIALSSAVAVYFLNRPSRIIRYDFYASPGVERDDPLAEAAEAFEAIHGPFAEPPVNEFGCYDCPPFGGASFVDSYIEAAVVLFPLLLISILGVDWIATKLRERGRAV